MAFWPKNIWRKMCRLAAFYATHRVKLGLLHPKIPRSYMSKLTHCVRCAAPVPKGRQRYCSPDCSVRHVNKRPIGYVVRKMLRERDGCVCALCGINASKKRDQFYAKRWDAMKRKERFDAIATAKKLGIPPAFLKIRRMRSWWDADHIQPIVLGGGNCGLDNFRTLCVPCHIEVTNMLRAELARKRRQSLK